MKLLDDIVKLVYHLKYHTHLKYMIIHTIKWNKDK